MSMFHTFQTNFKKLAVAYYKYCRAEFHGGPLDGKNITFTEKDWADAIGEKRFLEFLPHWVKHCQVEQQGPLSARCVEFALGLPPEESDTEVYEITNQELYRGAVYDGVIRYQYRGLKRVGKESPSV